MCYLLVKYLTRQEFPMPIGRHRIPTPGSYRLPADDTPFEPTGMSLLVDSPPPPPPSTHAGLGREMTRPAVAAKAVPLEHQPGSDDPGKRHFRAPPEVLHPEAQSWLHHVPVPVRPILTARRYPHVVNRLALYWSNQHQLADYFEELLVSARPGRRGFPPEVLDELVVLLSFIEKERGRWR